ncbi:MAG: insulinase family protein, partial [Oscillospiraceae bacterium]|nr:insulinase family protein [Oscillospiraceae bacterium]
YMGTGIKSIKDEQDSEVTYYIGQEISGMLVTFDEYITRINEVTKEDIEKVAENVATNTIYFLRN